MIRSKLVWLKGNMSCVKNIRSLNLLGKSDVTETNEIQKKHSIDMKLLPDRDLEQFRSFYPEVLQDITNGNLVTDLREVNVRISRALNYNVPNGRQTRGALFLACCKFINGDRPLEKREIHQNYLLAWCIEMFTSHILILDDILDNSEERRGKQAWFKNQNVGLNAINDAAIIQLSVFKLLYKHFSSHMQYKELLNVFVEANLKTTIGQLMDCDYVSFESFTMKRFHEIAVNKTGYYTFFFPVVLAMYASNRPDLDFHQSGLEVFKELGKFYQLQNDYMDCFEGGSGTDIQERKCSWLLVKALEEASPQQRRSLQEFYGKWDTACVNKVKHIYEELGLSERFSNEMDKSLYAINRYIDTSVKNELSKNLLKRLTRVCLGYEFYLLKD